MELDDIAFSDHSANVPGGERTSRWFRGTAEVKKVTGRVSLSHVAVRTEIEIRGGTLSLQSVAVSAAAVGAAANKANISAQPDIGHFLLWRR